MASGTVAVTIFPRSERTDWIGAQKSYQKAGRIIEFFYNSLTTRPAKLMWMCSRLLLVVVCMHACCFALESRKEVLEMVGSSAHDLNK